MKKFLISLIAVLMLCSISYGIEIIKGATSQIVHVKMQDSTTGEGKTGLTYADMNAFYCRSRGTITEFTLIDLTTLGTWDIDTTSNKLAFKAVGAGMPGIYEIDLPNNILVSGADSVSLRLQATNAKECDLRIELINDALDLGGVNLKNNCLVNLKMNDSDKVSQALENSMGKIPLSDYGIPSPAFATSKETSILKVSEGSFIGYRSVSGDVYPMTSTDGLNWTVSGTPLDLTPTIAAAGAEYSFVVKISTKNFLFVKKTSGGNTYCFDITTEAAPVVMNNGNPVLSIGTGGDWDTTIANTTVACDETGKWHILYEAHAAATDWQIGYATVTPANNPPLSTDTITFSKAGIPFVMGQASYLTYVKDRRGLLAIVPTTTVNGNGLKLQLFTASLADDLTAVASWKRGQVLLNKGDATGLSDAHLITDYKSNHPILMVYDNQVQTFETFIDCSVEQLYDRARFLNPTLRGNGNPATSANSVVGKIGGALNFDGSSDYLLFGKYNSSYAYDTTPVIDWLNKDWTISVWARQITGGSTQSIATNRFFTPSYWFDMGIYSTGMFYVKFTGDVFMSTSGTNPSVGDWHHYVLTHNATALTCSAYFDGALITTKDMTGINIGGLVNYFQVGACSAQSQYFNGDLDAFMLFDKPLTIAEVFYLYNGGAGVETSISTEDELLDMRNEIEELKTVLRHSDFGNKRLVRSTTPDNTFDVASTGEAGLDFDNIKQATGATTLTNITVPAVSNVQAVSYVNTDVNSAKVTSIYNKLPSGFIVSDSNWTGTRAGYVTSIYDVVKSGGTGDPNAIWTKINSMYNWFGGGLVYNIDANRRYFNLSDIWTKTNYEDKIR